MIIDPSRIPDMQVCRACRDVVGPFRPLGGRSRDGSRLTQRGTCRHHRPPEREAGWPRFDFNRQVDLCYCCGAVPLQTGSRWSVWFCDPCKEQVGLLNGRHGRCIVPLGRHSVHWGHLLRADQLHDTLAVERFLELTGIQGRVTAIVRDWSHEVVARNLSTIDMDDRPQVPVGAYCREARLRVEPMDRFREMCVYLDERGRAELDEPTRQGR